jgi:hypothetical protein
MRYDLPCPRPRSLAAIMAELEALRVDSARIADRVAVIRSELLDSTVRAVAPEH